MSGNGKQAGKNRRRGKRNEKALTDRLNDTLRKFGKFKKIGTLVGEDIENGVFSIEAKSREVLPAFITKTYQQAVDNCKDEGKIPLVVLHPHGGRREDDLCIIKLSDFETLLTNIMSTD